ncbi:MAG TPA: prephenate dehydratase domain-containing protein [Spirochaetota bacterium]|nr:prephenate dehydratase domain-containing protein [Spirochaetota bacterium]
MDLKKIREEIDLKDSLIVKLLNDRMELAILSTKLKTKIEDGDRENQVIENIKSNARGLIDPEFCANLYKQIMTESKRLQSKNYSVIGFAGEHGAYAELAAREWNDVLVPVPCMDASSVFEGVIDGVFEYGIVPVENTFGGVVDETNSLLIKSEVNVVGAVDLPVHHCLLTLPGTDYRDIRAVYSNQLPLTQCRNFIARNHLEPISYGNAISAAKLFSEKRPKAAALIASKASAELYNLEIIKENIEDYNVCRTRFLIISKERNTEGGNKCSVQFSTEHKAGTLFKILESFAKEDINLTRIESVPEDSGSFVFFLDFVGSLDDAKIKSIIGKMNDLTGELRILGCYNEKVVK